MLRRIYISEPPATTKPFSWFKPSLDALNVNPCKIRSPMPLARPVHGENRECGLSMFGWHAKDITTCLNLLAFNAFWLESLGSDFVKIEFPAQKQMKRQCMFIQFGAFMDEQNQLHATSNAVTATDQLLKEIHGAFVSVQLNAISIAERSVCDGVVGHQQAVAGMYDVAWAMARLSHEALEAVRSFRERVATLERLHNVRVG